MKDFSTLQKQLCFSLYEVSGEFTKLYSKALKEFDLTYPQYLVLLSLWEKDHVTMKDLGEQLNLGTGTLTPMISRMEASGWLRRERSSLDERKVFISLERKAKDQKPLISSKIETMIGHCQIDFAEYEMLMQQLAQLKKKLVKQTS
ncbi:MarR family transcriptional regulator [Pradoshia eiseniae]|uniref:HTH-type transcriptional regulator SarZ n=1 Tax=Pradoshia eiseniae TaxID=2064768 RepID=A0A2S7MYH2_9BACI|nr:MarR family transcriptional regulator [Pradoshia eiseniae]PQD94854.1 MarR family transcriptional regulator [Pradoshia eiseniae]